MTTPTIDMSKPTALYASAGALLLIATFVLDRLSLPSIAELLHVPNARAVAGGVLLLAVVAGLGGAQRHAARAKAPWRVPQSQPFVLFLLFFMLGLGGLALSI